MASVDVISQVEGADELRRNLRKFEKRFLEEMEQVLPREVETLMTQARHEAPARSGELRASASITSDMKPKRGRFRVVGAYLDEKAAAVHEGIHWGKKVEGGTKGMKWFERVANAWAPESAKRVVARLRALVGG